MRQRISTNKIQLPSGVDLVNRDYIDDCRLACVPARWYTTLITNGPKFPPLVGRSPGVVTGWGESMLHGNPS